MTVPPTPTPTTTMTTILPAFELHELLLGKFLGRGGFCHVHEIRGFSFHNNNIQKQHGKDDDNNDDETAKHHSRLLIAQQQSGETRFAVKHPRRRNDQEAIKDLVLETQFLRQMEHPHIIKLHGVSAYVETTTSAHCDNEAQLSLPLDGSYLLILDRLTDSLHARIRSQWQPRLEQEYKRHIKTMRRQQFLSCFAVRGKGQNGDMSNASPFLRQRLQIALDLSEALEYLHTKHHIWHRDLKPDNIGFCLSGHVKIFDFGLAKQQPPMTADNADAFLATQMTGTLRYMAPEVGLSQRYNAKCDSYSFVHMLWEMLTCQKPYLEINDTSENDTFRSFKRNVWIGKARPPLVPPPSPNCQLQRHSKKPMTFPKWTPLTQATIDILQNGWHADFNQRWCMSAIKAKLQEEVLRLKRLEDQDIEHRHQHSKTADATSEPQSCASPNLRRSTFVFGVNINSNSNSSGKDKCHHHSLVNTTANDDDNSNVAVASSTRSTRSTTNSSSSVSSSSSVGHHHQTKTTTFSTEAGATSIRRNTKESTIIEC